MIIYLPKFRNLRGPGLEFRIFYPSILSLLFFLPVNAQLNTNTYPHTPTYTTQNTTHTHAHPENIPGAIHPCPAPPICDAPLTCDARYGELAAHAVTQGGGRTRENASPPHRASRWGEGPGYCSLPSSAVREPLTSAPRRIGLILQTEKMEAGKESDRKAKAARP